MSANVWFEEVNKGLINEILKTVRIKNSSEDLVPLQKEAVIVRKPEEDFKLELLPCISIYNLSYKHDSKRYNPEPLKVTEDEQNHLITLEEPAVSFNLDYQLDFWSEYMIDMDVMTGTWLSNHFRQFNLKVIDDGGKRSEEHTSELQSHYDLVCRLLLEKKK